MGDKARDSKSYVGAALAFVTSADEGFARAAAEAARGAHVPVNVTDRPALCDFTTPAVIDRGEVVVAIGTGGASPMLATLLRHDIEARVPEGVGRVAALFAALQDEVRAALPQAHQRRAFLYAALSGPAVEAAMAGDMEAAKGLLRTTLAAGPVGGGVVQYVRGEGPVERLTLGASRALAAADVLAPDGRVAAEILALARREAERVDPKPARLIELAMAGQRVVRLVCAPAPEAERQALVEAGVSVEILPSAS